jgi:hypothetical protein
MSSPVRCAACGADMAIRDVAPCIDCGGGPFGIDGLRSGSRTYARVGLFDREILCDFCDAEMPSTAPSFWGSPDDLDWERALSEHTFKELPEAPPLSRELACVSSSNTLRKQEFIRRNAERNGVALSPEWWPHMASESRGRPTEGSS